MIDYISQSMSELPEQSVPLYCFRVIEENNKLKPVKFVINRYDLRTFSSILTEYILEGRSVGLKTKFEYVKVQNLDKILRNKFYTFEDDYERAEIAFEAHFKSNLVLARTKLTTAELNYDLWRGRDAQRKETAD